MPPRFNVLGVGVHALSLETARDSIIERARERKRGYVCFCDVNNVSCARRSEEHRRILNRSFLTTPDGMPLVWLGRRAGHPAITRVYGPDLLLSVAEATAKTTLRHFFCGAAPGTADALAKRLAGQFPGISIAGTVSPPFGELSQAQEQALFTAINAAKPDFLWIGLSTPKQEAFIARYHERLDATVVLAVGAAFDFLSGRVRQAPRWVQRSGFEWLWRLAIEPRRLAGRYLKNNPAFIALTAAQLTGLRRYPNDWSS